MWHAQLSETLCSEVPVGRDVADKKTQTGRPPRPDQTNDSPENIALAIVSTPPKQDEGWKHHKADD